MSQSYVIAQLQEENQRLRAEVAALRQEREQDYTCLLSTIATVANMLSKAPDYTTVLPDVVQLLGEAVGSSRCCIIQSQLDIESGKSLIVVPYEWSSSTAPNWHEATPVMFWEDFGDFWTSLSCGSVLNFLVEDQEEPAKSILEAQGNTSMLYVPIITKNECWGVIGFDNCSSSWLFNEEEIAILKVAASSIAGAVERKESSIERERLLQTITTIANQLLRADDYTTTLPEVLRSLGEAAIADRCCLVENVVEPQTLELAVRVHTKWCNEGIAASIDITPELASSAPWNNFPGVQEQLIQGEMVTLWIDELPEPSRSEFKKQGNIAMTLVPILVQEKFWGVFGFDYCSFVPVFDTTTRAIFTIAVDSIGAAIERQEKDAYLKLIQLAALEASQEKVARLASLNEELVKRDRILAATAQATNSLLTLENFDEAVNTALQTLGEELDADRVGLMENFNPQQEPLSLYWQIIYEWNSKGTVPQFSSEVAFCGNYADIEWLYKLFELGETASYQIYEAPEPFRSEQISIGVKSSNLVPIYVSGKWWGVLGVDDCCEAKQRSSTELAALKIAANCVGNAIERKRATIALLEAEQEKVARLASMNQALQERERLLEATATVANALLTKDNFDEAVNYTLRIIGETLDTDRVVIIDHFDQPLSMLPGWRILYEWDSEGTISQISHPSQAQGTYDGIEAFYESLNTGHSLSCLLEDMPEPFRSGQAELGVKSIHVIPIFIEGKFWGHAGFDDCREAKHRSMAELAALKIAANCVGSAIERKRATQALLEAEQQRARELEEHNIELQQTLLRLTESEERYRALMELSSEGIFRFEYVQPISLSLPLSEQIIEIYKQFQVVEHNQAYAQMYGYNQPNAMVGARLTDTHVMEAEENILQMSEFVRSGHKMRNQETVEIDRIGQKHYFLNNAFSIIKDGYAVGGWGTQIDITQLRQRDLLLSVVAKVTKELLRASDIDVAICTALKAIGESANMSRVVFIKEVLEPSTQKLQHHVVHEWTASGIYNHHELGLDMMDNSNFEVLIHELYQGKSIWRTIDDFPDVTRLHFKKLSIKSSGVVPIFIEGRYIGSIAFDDCITPRAWSQQEIDVLTAAAESIGAALHRKLLVERLVEERLKAEQERVAELAAANDALKRSVCHLTSSDSLQSFLNAVLQEAIRASGAANAAVFVYEPSLHALQMVAFVLGDEVIDIVCDERFDIWRHPIPADITDAWDVMAKEHRIIWIDNDNPQPSHWPIGISWHRQMGHKTIACIPMLIGEQTLGFLGLCFTSHQDNSSIKLEQCWTLAQHAALALRIAQLSKEAKQAAIALEQKKAAQQRVAQLATANTALKKTLDVLATEPELDKSLGHVLQVTTEHLGSSSAALWLYNQNTNTFTINLVYLNGNIIPATPENAHLLTNQWIRGTDLSRDLILKDHIHSHVPVLYDVLNCPKVSKGQRQFFKSLGVQALLGVPLLLGSEIVGSFTVRFNEKRQLQAEELELTQALAHQATLAIQLLRMAEEAKINVLLEERNRMAGEIHDTLAQGFTGIITYLEAGSRAGANQNFAKVQSCIDNALTLARSSLQEARRSVWALRPQALDQADLSIALHNWVEHLRSCTNIEINTQGEPCDLSPEVDRELLRIAQEAVVNALKHAQAPKITLDLIWLEAYLTLRISDNGKGFVLHNSAVNRGFGLISMQQRASRIGGQLMICSDVGQGAQISVTIPINANPITEVKHE